MDRDSKLISENYFSKIVNKALDWGASPGHEFRHPLSEDEIKHLETLGWDVTDKSQPTLTKKRSWGARHETFEINFIKNDESGKSWYRLAWLIYAPTIGGVRLVDSEYHNFDTLKEAISAANRLFNRYVA